MSKVAQKKKMTPKTKTIDGTEYETETHDFGKKLSDIKIPKGWRLWKPSECYKLYENEETRKEFNLSDCWFFVENPLNNGNVARFYAGSGWAYLYCRYPVLTSSALGVRFCREVTRRKNNKKNYWRSKYEEILKKHNKLKEVLK